MCEPVVAGRTRALLTGWALLLATAVPAASATVLEPPEAGRAGEIVARQEAQEAGDDRAQSDAERIEAELVRRIEEMLPRALSMAERARETNRTRDSLERIAAARPVVETVSLEVGPLRIITLPGQEGLATRIFAEEIQRMGPLARSAADALRDGTIVFQHAPLLRELDVESEGPRAVVEVRSIWGEDAVRRRIRRVLGERITGELPRSARLWLEDRPVSPADDPARLHRELILTRSRAATSCRAGDLEACWAAFGLSGSERPVPEWYTPRQVDEGGNRGLRQWLECSRGGAVDRSECYRDFLGRSRSWTHAVPLRGHVRADLVAFALELGGEGALERFLAGWPEGATGTNAPGSGPDETETPLPELGRELQARLAAAAGVPPDELMALWRERVVSADRGERSELARARWATGFWFLFFAALATRSTRWRLG